MTEREVIEKLVPYYIEVDNITEEIKQVIKDAKEAGLDGVALGKIAKAKAASKLGDLFDKTDALLNLMEPFVKD